MQLAQLVTSTLHDDCYRSLKRAIIDLSLAPGTPLVENNIADQLGISKTPVREALARLSGEGLVITESGNNRKNYVAELSMANVQEIYNVRLMLEPEAARQITKSLTNAELTELDLLIQRTITAVEKGEATEYVLANEGFHSYLIERHQNQYLMKVVGQLFDQVNRVRFAMYHVQQSPSHDNNLLQAGIENHRSILAALRDQDEEQAAAMVRADIQTFLDRIDAPVMDAALSQLRYQG